MSLADAKQTETVYWMFLCRYSSVFGLVKGACRAIWALDMGLVVPVEPEQRR